MEKINIAELLKDCPKGMKLYSPIFGEVYLDKIRPYLAIVVTIDKEQGDFKEEFLYDGRYRIKGECMLFPSKDKNTWEGFVPPYKFKDGDIVFSGFNLISIFKGIKKGVSGSLHSYVSTVLSPDSNVFEINRDCWTLENIRLATEEEKAKLFQAIKDRGYKWNSKTKTLEKLIEPKFKVGDRIVEKNGITKPFTISQVGGGYYYVNEKNVVGIIRIEGQDKYELVPDKFDISTLIPFESKVLVRDSDTGVWRVSFWGCLLYNQPGYIYDTIRGSYKQCIPYEGNEHLLGKVEDCKDFYKIWE